MVDSGCSQCVNIRAELALAHHHIGELEGQRGELEKQLAELGNLVELQRADLERYKKATEALTPNQPERVPKDQLQLAFERVLEGIEDPKKREALCYAVDNSSDSAPSDQAKSGEKDKKQTSEGAKSGHGRRRLDLSTLPVEEIRTDPDEVVASGGEGFERIGEETSERVAFRPGTYLRLRIIRGKWARRVETESGAGAIVTAPTPDALWPYFMADPSAIAHCIVSKYADLLPLYRQEIIGARHGFTVPRSTQCGWLKAADSFCARVVDAMFDEARAKAHCIATDATGAPVRAPGQCARWHVFAFLTDHDHVVFRYTPDHTSEAISSMLKGYKGYVLADASSIHDILFREHEMTEVGCWYHQRRYFWKALHGEPEPALEALALVSKLFLVEAATRGLSPEERTEARARRARPILDAFDDWTAANKSKADPGGRLAAAITYYENQKIALHRFLEDGRLRIDNNRSEAALRNLVLGRHNWQWFQNETGLRWYTTFRSLIASCTLHDLNPQDYLHKLLRLIPHWPARRVLDLSPKYWTQTLETLDDRQREILQEPWRRAWPTVEPPRVSRAA